MNICIESVVSNPLWTHYEEDLDVSHSNTNKAFLVQD